jgi:hypothetical protein
MLLWTVRYVAEGKPRLKAQCHCRECQYISGGALNIFTFETQDPITAILFTLP